MNLQQIRITCKPECLQQSMKCYTNENCPDLYYCQQQICVHQNFWYFSPNLLFALFLIPILTSVNNRAGFSSTWLLYPIIISTLLYTPGQTQILLSAIVLGGGIINLFFRVTEKNQQKQGPQINYYIANISLPPMIVSFNLGLILWRYFAFIVSIITAVILSAIAIFLYIYQYREIRAEEKIKTGHFRKLLPERYQTPRKSNNKLSVQMTSIQQIKMQSSSQNHGQMSCSQQSPTKQMLERMQIFQQIKVTVPWKQILVGILIYAVVQSLCLTVPHLISWASLASNPALNLLISYAILILVLAIAQVYLYKAYVQPIMIKQQYIKLSFGMNLDGIKILKGCSFGFLGGMCQGICGFGYSQAVLTYMFYKKQDFISCISTVSYLTFFLALSLTFNSFMCINIGKNDVINFFSLLGYTLFLTLMFQLMVNHLFENYIQEQRKKSSHIILMVTICFIVTLSVLLSMWLMDWKFGSSVTLQFFSIYLC